ncbi:MAG: N-6 DNA methylase [Egibacteraceae bacterium]
MAGDAALDRYLAHIRGLHSTSTATMVLGAVAGAVARCRGVDLDAAPLRPAGDAAGRDLRAAVTPPAHLARPELLGQVYEALRPRPTRRSAGAYYTPEVVAEAIVGAVLGPPSDLARDPRVGDPAVGGGMFLLAAGRHLVTGGGDPRRVVGRLYGVDIDPTAVAVTRTALTIFAHGTAPPADHIRVGDALLDDAALPDGLDAVVGNPPFLSQLAAATARSPATRRALRTRFGAAAGGYADTANLFLLLALRRVGAGGRVGLVLPDSFLVARDAGPARREAAETAALEWLWWAGEAVFDAGVRVCAPVFAVGRPQEAVTRRAGAGFSVAPPLRAPARSLAGATWAGLVADLLAIPPAVVVGDGTLADHCHPTADFRDQYYGLIPYVFEDGGSAGGRPIDERRYPRLVTTGLIDPARSLWGLVPTRFAKQRFTRPRVDVEALRAGTRLGPWSRARQVPKVLLATQSRVLEAVVDESGDWLPSTPTITVQAPPARLWHVAAALSSPPLTAVAQRRHAGAALSSDAITLSARHVAALPAPVAGPDWDAGATAMRQAAAAATAQEWRQALERCGTALCRAYAVDDADALIAWWRERLPPWRPAAGASRGA